jgi:hypothetical protein
MDNQGKNKDTNVGYGKPPKCGQWSKGVSGNPKGSPKGPRFKTLYANVLKRAVDVEKLGIDDIVEVFGKQGKTISVEQAIALRTATMALSGDMSAIKEITDRMDGKAQQNIGIGINPENVQEYMGDLVAQMKDRDGDSTAAQAGGLDSDPA